MGAGHSVRCVHLWQTLHHRLVNDLTEKKKCVPIAPVNQTESENSLRYDATKDFTVKTCNPIKYMPNALYSKFGSTARPFERLQ